MDGGLEVGIDDVFHFGTWEGVAGLAGDVFCPGRWTGYIPSMVTEVAPFESCMN